jgi:hypothetical protein
MEKTVHIRHILDTRLTTETLDKVYPPSKVLEEALLPPDELSARHKTVFIEFFELVGSIIELETGERLSGDLLMIVKSRIENFLIHRGFHLNQ